MVSRAPFNSHWLINSYIILVLNDVSPFLTHKGKEHCHVLRYLLAVSITTGRIVFLFGPYQGASNDLTLVHASNFLRAREENEWTLGDAIFRGNVFQTLTVIKFFSNAKISLFAKARYWNS